jgi:hypothetical protein
MDRYGSVMIARLAVAPEVVEASMRSWVDERRVPGFRHQDMLLCDDGVTVVTTVMFDSEADYRALADDPAQDQWWRETVMPMLDGEPQWLDGHWRMSIDAP